MGCVLAAPDTAQYPSWIHHLTINAVQNIVELMYSSSPLLISLETIEISFTHWIHAELSIPEATILFDNAPNLLQVVLSAEVYSHPEWGYQRLISLHLPWTQLTHLCIHGFQFATSSSTHALLAACSNLEECGLSIPFDGPPQELPPITLPHLRTLDITNKWPRSHGQFLRCLTLPSLRFLAILADFDTFGWPEWSQHNIVEMVGTSRCRIEEFTLTGTPKLAFLLVLLGEMPALVRLTIKEPSFLLDMTLFPSLSAPWTLSNVKNLLTKLPIRR